MKNESFPLPPSGVLFAFLPPFFAHPYRPSHRSPTPTTVPYHRTHLRAHKEKTNLRYTNSLTSLKPNPSVPTYRSSSRPAPVEPLPFPCCWPSGPMRSCMTHAAMMLKIRTQRV
ncbi:hypothetical protein B9Z19DRAFT_1108727 [Tuber borchii]|uniref:Uncharacterized protein n=1 Tax=Tuber borchii TaxID=42251 RepID=A0A2T6ZQA7_TUBBO|nr:hypothetical protein B9Z19DRAFT_1108727 [Tuber borchii]